MLKCIASHASSSRHAYQTYGKRSGHIHMCDRSTIHGFCAANLCAAVQFVAMASTASAAGPAAQQVASNAHTAAASAYYADPYAQVRRAIFYASPLSGWLAVRHVLGFWRYCCFERALTSSCLQGYPQQGYPYQAWQGTTYEQAAAYAPAAANTSVPPPPAQEASAAPSSSTAQQV